MLETVEDVALGLALGITEGNNALGLALGTTEGDILGLRR